MATDEDEVDVPIRYSRVDPWVISADSDAEIAFLTAVFEGEETPGSRMLGPDGRVGHVEVELGNAVIMLFDAQPDWAPTPAHLRIYVASTRDTFDRAVAAGARAVTRPTDLPFGECVARVRDPQGHLWWIHQRLEDVAIEEPQALRRSNRSAGHDVRPAVAHERDVGHTVASQLAGVVSRAMAGLGAVSSQRHLKASNFEKLLDRG